MSYLLKYNDLKKQGGKIFNEDFVVKKAYNIFTDQQIKTIYSIINNTPIEKTRLQKWAGHRAWDASFPKEIQDAITKAAQSVLGNSVKLNGDYSFARYSSEYGFNCKLFPHYDTRDTQRITFDIQLNADEPWAIVVENEKYFLNNNEALIFAGTQQIHWREKKELLKNSKIDMIFCHLEYVDPLPYDKNQDKILQERAKFLMDNVGINNNEEPINV
jgi:hypothetical protein